MENYAHTLVDEYVKDSFLYFPSLEGSPSLFTKASYTMKFIISSQDGAALWIQPSEAQSFERINSSDKIGIAVFGGDSNITPMFMCDGDNAISDIEFDIGNVPLLELRYSNSLVIVHNIFVKRTVWQQVYHFVILKGSNQLSYWTNESARADATRLIFLETGKRFPESAEFVRLKAVEGLTNLLEDIQTKLAYGNYTMSEYLNDLQNVQYIASQYGIKSDILNQIIGFVNAKKGLLPTYPFEIGLTPDKSANRHPDNWVYAIFCGVYPVIVFTVYSIVKLKFKDEDWAQVGHDQLINGVLISVGYAVLAVNYPYNSQSVVFEILLTVILAISSSISAIRIKKWLLTPRPSRVDATNCSDEESNKKQEHSPETEKKIG